MSPEERHRLVARDMDHARGYLERLVARNCYDGIKVQGKVLYGKVAERIIDYTNKNGIDLIIIAKHGRSGASRWVWGSVADRVLRSAYLPIIMIRVPVSSWHLIKTKKGRLQ